MNNMITSRNALPFKPATVNIYRNENIQLSFHNSITILYVEDNVINQELARKAFERIGCRLQIANDGYEALEMVTRKRYEMIFMDIDMPRINGYETTMIIRQNLCLKTPIVALTSRDSVEDVENCYMVGMNDHMPKPLNTVQLTNTIYRWNRKS